MGALLPLGLGMIALGATIGLWAPALPLVLLAILAFMMGGVGVALLRYWWDP